jgi:VWFA-related protein
VAALALSVLMSPWSGPWAQSPDPPDDEVRDSDLVEQTGITLQLLDVEVVDREGNPVRGLTEEDFTVTIDGVRKAEIYSVDDLCPCGLGGEPRAVGRPPGRRSASVDPLEEEKRRESLFARFVLYFDVSQLQLSGRDRAFAEAARWVRETLPEGKPAAIVAYHHDTGVRELVPFTIDRQQLLTGLEQARADPSLIDGFPSTFEMARKLCGRACELARRQRGCRGTCDQCAPIECSYPITMSRYGRQSFEAMAWYLQTLERVPGRKALILYTQNTVIFPGRLFPGVDSRRVLDLIHVLDRASAEANHSRTAIFPAYVGDDQGSADPAGATVNLGANLADFTGGSYNRNPATLTMLTDAVASRCSCIYRVALVVPEQRSRRVHRVVVTAGDRRVPFRYRIQFLDELDRWWRRARGVLANPAAADDVAVQASLSPVRRDEDGWTLLAVVGLRVDSLMLVPESGTLRGSWEVGALLHRESGGKRWEMLGKSEVRIVGDVARTAFVLHERAFERVPAGTYRIGAFIRDRTANAFGGGQGAVDLPRPGRAGLVGPLLFETGREVVRSTLPMRKKEEPDAVRATLEQRAVPVDARVFGSDEQLEFRSWICPGEVSKNPPELLAFVSRDDRPLFRFEPPAPQPAGDCFRVTDLVETAPLPAGEYVYTVRWQPEGDAEPIERIAGFEVVGESGFEPERGSSR